MSNRTDNACAICGSVVYPHYCAVPPAPVLPAVSATTNIVYAPQPRARVVHSRENVEAKWIDRTTKWGNPFKIGRDGTRDEVISKYREWIQTQYHLLDALSELAGHNLRCWCAPLPCHGDVLLELIGETQCEG